MNSVIDQEEPDYATRQRAADQTYRDAYREWVSGLGAEERKRLEALGLAEPHLDPQGVGGPELDEARLSEAYCQHSSDPLDAILALERDFEGDSGVREGEDGGKDREALQDALRALIGELFVATDTPLAVALMGTALGVRGCGVEEVAARSGRDSGWVHDESVRMRFRVGVRCREDEVALSRIVGELVASPNARLSLEVLALVSGICYEGLSQTSIARRHGVTRAAVSKRCVELTERLGLPPSRAMKSEQSRDVYRESQKRIWGTGKRFSGNSDFSF